MNGSLGLQSEEERAMIAGESVQGLTSSQRHGRSSVGIQQPVTYSSENSDQTGNLFEFS
ncbi:hypothetical protein [Rhodoferax fermentans]|uniref:hypothetical protein n=1 Tax=Rhodoferax fermentans TaxID=28066 RepID=UPI001301FD72|nr:hypothetical protein [Rhodoferax fermentans]